jgi:hypothetical protein
MNKQFYYEKIELQLTDNIGEYIVISEIKVPWEGPWALCGGGGTPDPEAEAEEAETVTFDQSLMNIFQQQYSTQQQQLAYLQGKMEPIINAGGQGYTSDQLASMRTAATDVNSEQFQGAQQALNNTIAANSGGSKLTGVAGSTIQANAELNAAEAQTQAQAQETITSQNAQLQQSNYWNAINALNGVAAQENPLGYASASNQAGSTVADLTNANANYIKSTQSPLMGALGGIIGGSVGGLFQGAGQAGGFGALFCWVAASFWGWDDLKTWAIRIWMKYDAPIWFREFYMEHGEYISRTPLRWAYWPIFEVVAWRMRLRTT